MRLDKYLSENNLVESREKAQTLIKNNAVLVNGEIQNKPSFNVEDELIYIKKDLLKYVSRGGFKLEKAIEYFKIKIENKIILDIGASTGGFTDCLLQHGALKVISLENGVEQLHNSLLNNPRVLSLENTNIMDYNDFNVDIITIDVSFVSLEKILLHILKTYRKDFIILIKPQFECGKQYLNKHNVCKDEKVHLKIIEKYRSLFFNCNYFVGEVIKSPILGKKSNNTEYLMYCRREK